MNNNYILRQENSLTAFYLSGKKICAKKYENGKFGDTLTVLDNALSNFTMSMDKNGEASLYCRDSAGNIVLVSQNGGEFFKKILLENKSDEIQNLLFYPVNESGIGLIYNIPSEQKRYKLLIQRLMDTGSWAKPVEIDSFQPHRENLFYIQPHEKKSLLCYMNVTGTLGMREISENQPGNFIPLVSHSENITNYNIFRSKNTTHFIYINSNLFGNRLIYRKKEGESFSKPQILWESQRMDNCLLWIHNSILWAGFMSAGNLYIMRSVNNGASFSPPEIYKNKFCKNPVKAVFLSSTEMEDDNFYAKEVYVDSHNPWDIQILPDLCQNFYPKIKVSPPPPAPAPKPAEEIPKPNILMERLTALSAENQELRYKYARSVEAFNESSFSYETLKNASEKNREILESQINVLKSKIFALETEISDLKSSISTETSPKSGESLVN